MGKIVQRTKEEQQKLNAHLFSAIRGGSFKEYSGAVKSGADVNAKIEGGETPFIAAAAGGHLRIMKDLKRKGANIHARTKDGHSALGACLRNGGSRRKNGGHPLVEHYLLTQHVLAMRDLRFHELNKGHVTPIQDLSRHDSER